MKIDHESEKWWFLLRPRTSRSVIRMDWTGGNQVVQQPQASLRAANLAAWCVNDIKTSLSNWDSALTFTAGEVKREAKDSVSKSFAKTKSIPRFPRSKRYILNREYRMAIMMEILFAGKCRPFFHSGPRRCVNEARDAFTRSRVFLTFVPKLQEFNYLEKYVHRARLKDRSQS